MPENDHQATTDEQSKLESFRRDVLKAVGAGSALGVFGGTATAATGTDGTAQMDDGESTDEERTVHTVRTLIGPSTNPNRPADFFFQPTGISIDTGDVVKFVFETPDHTVTSYHPAFGMQRRIPPGEEAFSSPLLGWDPDSLPDDINMPPAEDGTIAGGGEDGTETPSDDETETPPESGSGAEEDDTDTTSDNETDEPTGSATDTVSTPEENPQTSPDDDGTEASDGADSQTDGERVAEPSVWLREFDTAGVYDLECAPHESFGMAMRIVVGDVTETAFETSDAESLPEPRAGPVGLARQVLTDGNLEPAAILDAGEVMWQDLQTYNEPEEDGTEDGGPEEETPGEEPIGAETETGTAPGDAGNETVAGNESGPV